MLRHQGVLETQPLGFTSNFNIKIKRKIRFNLQFLISYHAFYFVFSKKYFFFFILLCICTENNIF